ncbi:Cut8-domain-containing protein [Microthyrium microscopicum]|uniref:Tethering factor for nuclear proteasome STS1 n=1 Tax=Microthyrium microscopicum TaxID=703497 RepID=A0A6A6U236_9PEZI|nr:Cut8-domain-containing protein [Microthyrium microscopicum]
MNTVLPNNPFLAPHLHPHRLSPSRSQNNSPNQTMQSRKRKADDDDNDGDTRMSKSPSASPLIPVGSLPHQRIRGNKRIRSNLSGRPLTLPRLLETLSQDDLRNLLRAVCERHPDLSAEVTNTAPRPNLDSVLAVMGHYESAMRASFPFGREHSDYAYNRVRQPLLDLLDALRDFTPTFLPPNEPQTGVSLKYLDAVTHLIHRLPDFDNFQNNRHKHEAYEELARAWACVIKEAGKRGGGIQLRISNWDEKIEKHNEASGNRMQAALQELHASLNWMAAENAQAAGQSQNDASSIRQQLFSGTYGEAVRVGPW